MGARRAVTGGGGGPWGGAGGGRGPRGGAREHGEDVRLPLQAAAHRRLGRGQDVRALPLLRGRLQRHLHLHHRSARPGGRGGPGRARRRRLAPPGAARLRGARSRLRGPGGGFAARLSSGSRKPAAGRLRPLSPRRWGSAGGRAGGGRAAGAPARENELKSFAVNLGGREALIRSGAETRSNSVASLRRYRFQNSDHRAGWEENQTADLVGVCCRRGVCGGGCCYRRAVPAVVLVSASQQLRH